PGFVRISTRLLPGESYSDDHGFELIRISRMDDFGGIPPLLNPSVYIWLPPAGPEADPARACSCCASSSGSSDNPSNSVFPSTVADAFASGSRLTVVASS